MITLALETSGGNGDFALLRDGIVVAQRENIVLPRRQTQMLVPELIRFLAEQNISPRDVDLVGVSIGPGAFTSLRVGVTCAKTFAYGIRKPIVGVDTFEALAMNGPPECALAVIGDAQRRGVILGAYSALEDGRRSQIFAPQMIERDEVRRLLREFEVIDLLSGPGIETLSSEQIGDFAITEPFFWKASAGVVGALAEVAFASDGPCDLMSLEPNYGRRSSAEDQWDARKR